MPTSGNRHDRKPQRLFRGTLFSAVFLVPLDPGAGWRSVSFSKITPNAVEFSTAGLTMKVAASSSPLLLPLDPPRSVARIRVKGSLTGVPHLPAGKREGESGVDDYALRVGLVRKGERRLGWFGRLLAPRWLRDLEETVRGEGVGGIDFFNLAQHGEIGARKIRPGEIRMEEEIAGLATGAGPFAFERPVMEGSPIVGLWLQADGDDTGSVYEVVIREMTLTPR